LSKSSFLFGGFLVSIILNKILHGKPMIQPASHSNTTHPNTENPYTAIIAAPLAEYPFKLGIRCDGDALSGIDFLPPESHTQIPVTAFAQEVVAQLHAYFKNPRFDFDIPLLAGGTAFQQQVWQALRGIAPGAPQSYGQLARQLHSSARAIGGACRRNPIPIIVPCHRVVARQGLGGFAGDTQGHHMIIKQWLLNHEVCA
jgi:methylated-DNA-[protein]-cysteine S-methyltransferase